VVGAENDGVTAQGCARGDHLASYAGLVPSTRSRGGVERHGRITREGSRWLRWAMVEAARKLVTVCYSVLVNRRPYFNPLDTQAV